MPRNIPMKEARELAKRHDLTHVIILARGADGRDHVVTYGRSIEQCGEAADFGNRLKQAMGWPECLQQAQPSRVRRLQERVRQLGALANGKFAGLYRHPVADCQSPDDPDCDCGAEQHAQYLTIRYRNTAAVDAARVALAQETLNAQEVGGG